MITGQVGETRVKVKRDNSKGGPKHSREPSVLTNVGLSHSQAWRVSPNQETRARTEVIFKTGSLDREHAQLATYLPLATTDLRS